MDEMRAQLASLMESIKAQPTDFTDPEVCKYYLTGLCPHDLFENTETGLYIKGYRFSLGACKKTHSEELRARYLEARKTKRYGYEELSIQVVKSLIEEAERKVEKGNLRSDDEGSAPEQLSESLVAELKELEEDIDEKLREVERLTEKGLRDEAAALNEVVAALQVKRCKLMFRGGEGNSQKLRPCDVCGALLSVHDSGKRLDEHFQGRIHIGFQKLRNVLKRHLEYIASAPLPDAALRPQQKGTLSVNAMVALNQVNSQPVQRVDLDALAFITEAQRRALPHIAAAVAPPSGAATEEVEDKASHWKEEKSADADKKRSKSHHDKGGQHKSSSSKKKERSSSSGRHSKSRSRDRKKSGSSSSGKTRGEHRSRKERSSGSSNSGNSAEGNSSSGGSSGTSSSGSSSSSSGGSSSSSGSSSSISKQKGKDRGHGYKEREDPQDVKKDSSSKHHKKSKRKE